MSQYFPAGKALKISGLERPVSAREYDEAVAALEDAGLEEGWVQEIDEERRAI
jgi:putative pyruvate formate lyase activating enzyme